MPDGQLDIIDIDQITAQNDAAISLAVERIIQCIEHLAVEDGEVDAASITAIYQGDSGEPNPYYLDGIVDAYGLDAFERKTLLLCLVANLDSDVVGLARELQGVDRAVPVTVALALSLFSDGGHDHFLANGRLIQNGLIRLIGDTLYEASLVIEPSVLSYLITGECEEAVLEGMITPFHTVMTLSAVQEQVAASAARAISDGGGVIQLVGYDRVTSRALAAYAGANIGCSVGLTSFFHLPSDPHALSDVAHRWRRKSILDNQLLVVDASGASPKDREFNAGCYLLQQFVAMIGVPLVILSEERINFHLAGTTMFDVPTPTRSELTVIWHKTLYRQRCLLMAELFDDEETIEVEDTEDKAFAEELSACFAFTVSDIHHVVETFYNNLRDTELSEIDPLKPLELPFSWRMCWWQAARECARPSFDGLARRIETKADFSSLVTDTHTKNVLQEIIDQFNARPLVRGLWGMEPAFQRGTGITVLFAGGSGTGKTLAAEVMASELSLDLYQIDLSQMVSKYIGETQKNLSRVFEAAERGGSILLFDEADALFSKRTEVKDSKDRHANMEVGYLLQRMEAYSGIAILTSNLKEGMDDAFLRRLQYVVDFPFPTTQMRAELWQTMLPTAVPTHGLPAPEILARVTLTGAQIRNVIRRAVYRAASDKGQLETEHLLHAAHAEMEKSDRALSLDDLKRLFEC